MDFPGVSSTPEELERWLDGSADRRINCARIEARWRRIPATSPSGKALFECQNCGRVTTAADKSCYPLVGDRGKWR